MYKQNRKRIFGVLLLTLVLMLSACMPITAPSAQEEGAMAAAETVAVEQLTRESGATVTVQSVGDVKIHSYTAPEEMFAMDTHIIESANSLVLIDAQMFMPFALDYRAYADSLGKPIERIIITHAHPDHYLGMPAFADVASYALAGVKAEIEATGEETRAARQQMMGDVIANELVPPADVLEPGTLEIDGVTYEFEEWTGVEADLMLVTKLPAYGVISVGDTASNGVHLFLAGNPVTWIPALETLKGTAADYPIVLPGHGLPGDPTMYDASIAWLTKAGELLATVKSGEEFRAGMVEAFPDLGMVAAIDFFLPFLFPDAAASGAASETASETLTVTIRNAFQAAMTGGQEMVMDEAALAISDAVEYDGIIFDIDVSADTIRMVFNISERAQMDPTGVIGADIYERYYISFDEVSIVSASVDESSTVTPNLTVTDGVLLVEFAEGMELGVGNDVIILIETK